jgi:thioredoxin-related protein
VERFAVKGYPTVIFIDSSGDEIANARIVGYVNSADVLKRIDQVR